VGNPGIVGGLSRQFYHRVFLHYRDEGVWKHGTRAQFTGAAGQNTKAIDADHELMWVFEPHAAERIFDDLVHDANVVVVFGERLDLNGGVTKDGPRITAIKMESSATFTAAVFIDASYEGDLMSKAGVRYAVGREGNDVYGETINGIQAAKATKNQLPQGIDPYVVKGDRAGGLLAGVNANPGGADGTCDKRIQAYCYRMCLTDVPENRVALEKPEGYDESRYELLFRAIEAGQTSRFFKFDLMPNRKTDSNNDGGISTDFIGMNYDYPEADYATREKMAAAHEDWQRGLVWTLQNHPRVPPEIRDKYAKWGLPKDEFIDDGNWSRQLYVRESRRMLGERVATERNLRDDADVRRSIGVGAYTMDSHNTQRYVDANGHVRNEGDVQIRVPKPYRIDYGSITPKASECTNLLVPVCLSASHIAYGSIRMEPVFMILGQSAGTAASAAIDDRIAVQDVKYEKLRERLVADGQVLELSR
jgi:hypothetical protein